MLWQKRALWAISIGVFLLVVGSFLPSAAGFVAKVYVRLDKGWTLTYKTVTWKEGSFVFSDLVVKDPDSFSLSTSSARISLTPKAITLDRPILKITNVPKWDASSSNWSCFIPDGLLEIKDLPQGTFTVMRDVSLGVGKVEIACLDAHVLITMENSKTDLIFDEIPLAYIPEMSGIIHGAIHLEDDLILNGLIAGDNVSFGEVVQGLSGEITWDGPILWTNAALDIAKLLNQSKLRFAAQAKKIATMQDVEGKLVFDGNFRANFDFSYDKQVQGFGTCFFDQALDRSIEADIFSNDTSFFIQGKENKDTITWEIIADSLTADFIRPMLDIANVCGIACPYKLENGIINGNFQLISHNDDFTWKINECSLKNIVLKTDDLELKCEESNITDGAYVFNGATLVMRDQKKCQNLMGQGDLSTGLGRISGNFGDLFFSTNYEGNWNAVKASFHWSGVVTGEGVLHCARTDRGIDFQIEGGKTKSAYGTLENVEMQGEIGPDSFSLFGVKGLLDVGKKIPFYCPIIQSEGVFDIRFLDPLFEVARIAGKCSEGSIFVDPMKSHVLGSCIQAGGKIDKQSLKKAKFICDLPSNTLSYFTDVPFFIEKDKTISCQLYHDEKRSFLKLKTDLLYDNLSLPLAINVHSDGPYWKLSTQLADAKIDAHFSFDQEGLQIFRGTASGDKFKTDFSGKIATLNQWEFNLSNLLFDLSLANEHLHGELKGDGILHWKGTLEADFDLQSSSLQVGNHFLENEGSLHVFCSSKMGLVCQGLNLFLLDLEKKRLTSNCKVGLFQLKPGEESFFSLTEAQFHFSANLFQTFLGKFPSLAPLISQDALQGVCDLCFSSDFSKLSLSMKEALIPFDNKRYDVRDLHVDLDKQECKINLGVQNALRLIPIDLNFYIHPTINGRLTIENGLKVDWSYHDKLVVHSVEGRCAGIVASFQLDGDSLIGSAQINGNEFRYLLPEKIANVFHELKIGDGFDLMGRLSLDHGIAFQGILSGKQIELFGFELKNLLAKIKWDADHLEITDLKISDFAGVLKVESIRAQGVGDEPWSLSIPHIVITELRPTLLQDVGGPPGKLSPLVVRELRIDDFQGMVEDSKSYTAKGELYFINSYKRETSLLELPSDLLSRIVGLDLELLVPVCGTLKYELHDGFFHFTELLGSYSENKRSEFFLVYNEDSPKMDLDWNLNILIQTKQFVLFKLTEAFIISVSGKLDDPQFQLQRKKRFFNVL